MRFCDVCNLPIGFVPVWKNGRIFRWKAVNPDGSPIIMSINKMRCHGNNNGFQQENAANQGLMQRPNVLGK